MPLASYQDLQAWQVAMQLAEAVYQVSGLLPESERYGLISQIRRAAVSVPSNIAEGYGRTHRGDYVYHLSVANGSLKEVETHLILMGRLGFVTQEQARPAWDLAQSAGRLLNRLLSSLQSP